MKPSIPSGMRDFSSEEVYKRQYIFNTIRTVFEKYGYQPIETPTMENLSTLEGKYGEEGDRLLFRVLDSGDYLAKTRNAFNDKYLVEDRWKNILNKLQKGIENQLTDVDKSEKKDANSLFDKVSQYNEVSLLKSVIEDLKSGLITNKISEKGLRYDLTVPFARYVVMHQNDITFPFKRYQIQSVFRADRPQKGRYREFFQCDADVVGSDSLLNEVELIQIYDEVFSALKIPVQIKINNRKILVGIAEELGLEQRFFEITVIIDKLDKIGFEGIKVEFKNKGFNDDQVRELETYFSASEIGNEKKLASFQNRFLKSEKGRQGTEELKKVLDYLQILNPHFQIDIDFSLARGLSYYTGTILEVVATSGSLKSSLGGGGRYDDLTGIFGLKNVSGVGISFGADRIYDVMEELKLFPEATQKGTSVLFINFDEAAVNFILPVLKKIRDEGIAAEIYPSAEKLKKQMKYADDKKIPFVVFAGEEERNSNQLTIKNMNTGEQEKIAIEEIIFRLKEKLT